MGVFDERVIGLQQPGPPPGANNIYFRVPFWYLADRVADLRLVDTHLDNERSLLYLLGQDEPYDGNLQGIYKYWPNMETAEDDDGATWIHAHDGRSAWRKIA
jgi:hypothetical protein